MTLPTKFLSCINKNKFMVEIRRMINIFRSEKQDNTIKKHLLSCWEFIQFVSSYMFISRVLIRLSDNKTSNKYSRLPQVRSRLHCLALADHLNGIRAPNFIFASPETSQVLTCYPSLTTQHTEGIDQFSIVNTSKYQPCILFVHQPPITLAGPAEGRVPGWLD